MASVSKSFNLPIDDKISDANGVMARSWQWFFLNVQTLLRPLGEERDFTLVNSQSSAADITNLVFNKAGVTGAIVEYLVQRVTDSVELTEFGSFGCAYNPTSLSWSLFAISENSPDNANIVFSITSAGQVQYTTSNEAGTGTISKIWYRSRTLAGKHNLYSKVNR